VQDPCCSGSVQASDIIVLDTPCRDSCDLSSSSYGLSHFSSNADSHPGEGAKAVPDELLSLSVGYLWPGIDQLDDIDPKDASAALAQNREWDRVPHCYTGSHEVTRMGDSSNGDLGASSVSCAPPCGCGGGSAKNKATRILACADMAISP
jgi:hypothetical protein